MKNYPNCLHCGAAIHSPWFPDGFYQHDYLSWLCKACGKQTTVGYVETFSKGAGQKSLKI